MLKRKVIAFDIQNLTDARYFAAWGVDYLHFDLDNISVSSIKQITDWISGVSVLLSINTINWNDIKDYFDQDTCWIGSSDDNDNLIFKNSAKRTVQILIESEINNLNKSIDSYFLLPDSYGVAQLEQLGQGIGVAIKGGAEEKVGLKSYEELDDIFEYLEED